MRKILELTLTSGLLAATAVLAVPDAALAAPPPTCRVSGPTTMGEQVDLAEFVNNRDEVVAQYSDPQNNDHTSLWSRGAWQEVGLPGSKSSWPVALTDSGYVLGSSFFGHTSSDPDGLRFPGFLWYRGTVINLSDAVEPGLPEDPGAVEPYVYGMAMNESGLVAGYETDRALINYGVTWQHGKLTRIPTLGGWYASEPSAVNDAGLVAVSARLPDDENTHAAVWDGHTLHDLGTLGGAGSYARDINAAGHVVGDGSTADGVLHAFLYRHGEMIKLGMPPGGTWAVGDFVNDRDEVVGMWRGADGQNRVFVWDHGRITDLGAGIVARGINERGQVVAWQDQGATLETGFVWTDGTRVNLPGLFPGGLAAGEAINDHGVVVGWARTPDGVERSVRWTVTCDR